MSSSSGITAVIKEYAANSVATFSYPFSRFGIVPIGGRSTAVRLRDGTVWVLASTPLDEPTKVKIESMGNVGYLIAADNVHHLFLSQYKDAFPSAKVIGVEGLEEKRPEIKFDGVYGKDPPETQYGFESEIVAKYFPTFQNKDVLFLHKDSKTLVTADLLFNLPCNEQYKNTPSGKPSSWIPFVGTLSSRLSPYSSMHKNFLASTGVAGAIPGLPNGGSTAERKKRFAQDAADVAKWDFERIIMCHGDVIETDAQKAWRSAYEKFVDADGNPKF